MRRVGAIAAAFVLFVSGCSGAGTDPDSSPTAEDRASPEPPPTTTAQAEDESAGLPDPDGWATEPELAWLRQYGGWASRLRQSVRGLAGIVSDTELVRDIEAEEPDAVARFDELVSPLRTCADDFAADVSAPPTRRLAEAAGLVDVACGHYARVAEAGMKAVRDDGDETGRMALQAFRRAVTAGRLLSEKLPPGEAQRLPLQDEKGTHSRVNGRYGQVARRLVETNVEVRCWDKRDWKRVLREASLTHDTRLRPGEVYGYVGLGSSRVNFAPWVCHQLDRLVYDGVQPRGFHERLLMSAAVGALGHESYHRIGVESEAAAECYGMQRIREAGRALGARPAYADGLAQLAWETYDLLPRGYRSPQCRDGGKLDLDRIGGSPWP